METQIPVCIDDTLIIKLKPPPRESCIVSLSDNKVVSVPYDETMDKLCLYDVDSNTWKNLIRYPQHFGFGYYQIVCNTSTSSIYYTTYRQQEESGMMIIDLASSSYNKFLNVGIPNTATFVYPNSRDLISHSLVEVNGKIHAFSLGKLTHSNHLFSVKHWIWDTNHFRLISGNDDLSDVRPIESIAIYIASKQSILFVTAIRIFVYSLKSHELKWIRSVQFHDYANTDYYFYPCQAILTNDEKHVILADGRCGLGQLLYNVIAVLDINDDGFVFRDKYINNIPRIINQGYFPEFEPGHLFKTRNTKRDTILVHGYVRELFRSSMFKDMRVPPNCLIKIISDLYSSEMVHWHGRDEHGKRVHVAIRVDDILRFTK